jgi:hypothetical protein
LISREYLRDLMAWNASLEARVQALIEAANDAGGRDNIAVVLVTCDSLPDAAYDAPKAATPKGAATAFPPPRVKEGSSPDLFLHSIAETPPKRR